MEWQVAPGVEGGTASPRSAAAPGQGPQAGEAGAGGSDPGGRWSWRSGDPPCAGPAASQKVAPSEPEGAHEDTDQVAPADMPGGKLELVEYPSTSSSWSWSELITQQYREHEDDSLRGLVLQDTSAAAPRDSVQWPRRGAWSRCNGVLATAKQFPLHCAAEVRHCVVPMLFMLIPMVSKRFTLQAQLDLNWNYSGSMHDVAFADTDSLTGLWLAWMEAAIIQIGIWGTVATWLYTLWSSRVMQPLLVRCGVPVFVSCITIAGIYYVPIQYFHVPVVVRQLLYATYHISAAVGVVVLITRCGRLTFNPAFKVILVLLLALSLTALLFSNTVVAIAVGPDWMKALFVGFVNPVVWEFLFIAPARFVARTLWHNDASTSFVIVPIFIFGKQYMGRSIAALVDSQRVLLVLSVLNCFWETFLRVSLRWRDKCLYRCVFSSQLPPGTDAAALLLHERNTRMRALNSMSESIGEIVAIWSGVAMIILLDVSVDGQSPMNAWKAVQAGFVQSAFELLTDMLSVLLLSYLRIHVLDLARGRYWCWSATLACPVLLMSSYSTKYLISHSLCHDPGFQEATFVACQKM